MAKAIKSHGATWVAGFAVVAVLLLSGCATPAEKEAKFLETGKRLLVKKDYQRALLQFRNAVQMAPKDPEAQYQLALGYLGVGAAQQAIATLNKTVQLDPKHVQARLKLAELMVMSNSKEVVEDAQKRLEDVLAVAPNNAEALSTLALTKLRLGETQDAEQDLLKALDSAPTHLQSSILLASVKLSQKDVAGATQVMKDAVSKDPNSKDAVMALGRLYRVLRRYPEAEAQYQRAIQIDPKDGAPLVELGAIQMATGRKDLAEQTYRKVAALPVPTYRGIHAQFLLSERKTDPAIAELKELLKKDEKDRNIRSLLVSVYLATNKMTEATNLLSDVLARNPKDVDALFGRARIRFAAGQYLEAQKDLLPVLNLKPDLAPAHHLLAKVYQAQGSLGAYRQELDEAIRKNPRYLNARLEMASVLMNSGAAQAALDLMEQTPPEQKNSIPVIVQRNGALMGLGRWDEVGKGIEEGLKIGRSPDLLIQQAILKMQRKDPAGGRKSVEEALTLAPENLRALDVLVGTYRVQGQTDPALRRIQEYAVQHPKSAPIQRYLGAALLANGKRNEARAAFLAAKAVNPDYVDIDLSLAQLDLIENKQDNARKILTAVLSKNDANVGARMMLAGLEFEAGNGNAAVPHYRKVIEKDSRNALALNNLAYLLADQDSQADEALKYAQQAKELAPNDASVDDTLGWVYYRKGIYQTSANYLEAAVAKEPSARRKYHLAMAYAKLGDRRRGSDLLQQAIKMDPKLQLPEAALAQRALEGR